MSDNSEILPLAAAAVAGALLGVLYFGGLWWTVRRVPRSRAPVNLYFASLVVRLVLLLAAFYGMLVAYGWPALAVAAFGFLGARLLLVRFLGLAVSSDVSGRETS
jgi:F1F0 ATPase subunit 2